MNMEHVLMNFGDNARVMQDSGGKSFTVGIGEIVRADIHPVHASMIQRAIGEETMIVCDMELAEKAGRRFGLVMQCLRDLDQEDYDALLVRFNEINGPNPDDLRPTRDMVRIALREIARQEVKRMLKAQRVRIHEQGDEVTRQEPPREKPPADKPPQGDRPAPGAPRKAAGAAGADAPGESPRAKPKIKRERL
jgi:hypothetical protein